MSASRLQQGFESEINLGTFRRDKVDVDMRLPRRIDALTAELGQHPSRHAAAERETTQSEKTSQELLQDTQSGWQKASADLPTITASNEKLRAELASSVGSSACEVERSARSNAHFVLVTEQVMVSKLNDKNSELRRELREWESGTTGRPAPPLMPTVSHLSRSQRPMPSGLCKS